MGYWSMGCMWDVVGGRWAHAVFQAVNVALLSYAVGRFIGWRPFLADLLPRTGRSGTTGVEALRPSTSSEPVVAA
jgi:hypothetical protein